MQICPGSRAPPPPSYLYKYGLIPACSSRSVTDRHELGDTNTFPARGRQLLQEEEDRDGVCPTVQESAGCVSWVEVAPTENMVISRSEFWSCQQAMEMSHQGGHIVYLLCVCG